MCSINTATAVVKDCLVFSQPEPIRLADIASRAALREKPEHAQAAAEAAIKAAVGSYTQKKYNASHIKQ